MEEMNGLLRDRLGDWQVTAKLIEPTPPRRRRRIPKRTKAMLLMRQHHRCAICSGPLDLLTAQIDHIVPFADGGGDDMENLRAVHGVCNQIRGRRRLVVGQGTIPWS
jgi:5-methylcytosine-specific restriction endonuclease McrA